MPEPAIPLVSVCIPTYGHGRFLPAAIESVLGQSLPDFEVIVSGDGPDHADETASIIRSYGDERIRFNQLPRHAGVAENRNACLRMAKGRYVAWLDADDLYEPDALACLSGTLDAHSGASFAHGGFQLIDEADFKLRAGSNASERDMVEPSREAFTELAACNDVTTSTVMVRRSAQERAGDFDASIGRSSTDWNMWLRLALLGDVAFLRQPLARYRLHADTISAQTSPSGERLKCDIRAVLKVFAAHSDQIPDHGETLAVAKAGLTIRWLLRAEAELRDGHPRSATLAAVQAYVLSRGLSPLKAWYCLFSALRRDDEYGMYRARRAVIDPLYARLARTRYGDQVRKLAVPDREWEAAVIECACIVRRVTERDSRVAAIDKHDPSLLHFSRRNGIHFPESGAYPRDDEEAIESVERLAGRGIRYLIIPAFSFWWLDFYQGLAAYLQTHYSLRWDDSRCMIYELL
jgi:glycosyltransferase involved in cell wall biosynthesis